MDDPEEPVANGEKLESLLSIEGNSKALGQLQRQYNAGLVSPFIGAGMSTPFGFPLWDGMLKKIAEDVGLRNNSEFVEHFPDNLPRVATLLIEKANATQYQKSLESIFADDTIANDEKSTSKPLSQILEMWNHRGPIFTTNFDHVIELHLKQMGMTFEASTTSGLPGTDVKSVVEAIDHRKFQLVKLHGDVDITIGRIDSAEAYHAAYNKQNGYLLAVFRKLIFARTLLFLGCGLKDKTADILRLEFNANAEVAFEHFAIAECNKTSGTPAKRFGRYLTDRGITPLWIPSGRFDLIETLLEGLHANAFESRVASTEIHMFVAARRSGNTGEQVSLASCQAFANSLGFANRIPPSRIIRDENEYAYVACSSRVSEVPDRLSMLSGFARDNHIHIAAVVGDQHVPTNTLISESTQIARDILFLAKAKSVSFGTVPVVVSPEVAMRLKLNSKFYCSAITDLIIDDERLADYSERQIFLSDQRVTPPSCVKVGNDETSILNELRGSYQHIHHLGETAVTWKESPSDKSGTREDMCFAVTRIGKDWRLRSWPPMKKDQATSQRELTVSGGAKRDVSWNSLRVQLRCSTDGTELKVSILTDFKNEFAKRIYGTQHAGAFVRVYFDNENFAK